MSDKRRVNLALQGGGAHGAFTWGVLDRLLEDERLEIDGISGTSAGAMNAAVLAQGFAEGGRAGARATLERFWLDLSAYHFLMPSWRTPLDAIMGNWNIDNGPAALAASFFGQFFSPYQTNPLGVDLLRDELSKLIDVERVRGCNHIKLFISATNVRTGKIRVFNRAEFSIDALLASACLPSLFRAVELDGEAYWDGGYMGNPAIFPLIYECDSRDVIIVQVNPLTRESVPQTSAEISDRLNDIIFNSSLMREMRAIAFVLKLLDEKRLKEDESNRLRRMNIHIVAAEAEMSKLGAASKSNLERAFLLHLKELGRSTADAWLHDNFDALGNRSSIDIREKFL